MLRRAASRSLRQLRPAAGGAGPAAAPVGGSGGAAGAVARRRASAWESAASESDETRARSTWWGIRGDQGRSGSVKDARRASTGPGAWGGRAAARSRLRDAQVGLEWRKAPGGAGGAAGHSPRDRAGDDPGPPPSVRAPPRPRRQRARRAGAAARPAARPLSGARARARATRSPARARARRCWGEARAWRRREGRAAAAGHGGQGGPWRAHAHGRWGGGVAARLGARVPKHGHELPDGHLAGGHRLGRDACAEARARVWRAGRVWRSAAASTRVRGGAWSGAPRAARSCN